MTATPTTSAHASNRIPKRELKVSIGNAVLMSSPRIPKRELKEFKSGIEEDETYIIRIPKRELKVV